MLLGFENEVGWIKRMLTILRETKEEKAIRQAKEKKEADEYWRRNPPKPFWEVTKKNVLLTLEIMLAFIVVFGGIFILLMILPHILGGGVD